MRLVKRYLSSQSAQIAIRDVLSCSSIRKSVQQELKLGRRSVRHLIQQFCSNESHQFSTPDQVVKAFHEFARHQQTVHTNNLMALCDLRGPAQWYPLARTMRRQIIFHCGPTNSGKTHGALTSLESADTGLYAGPLRLLAWEVHQRLNHNGIPCDLMTGQEIIEIPMSNHKSSTVEMTSCTDAIDCAVIDEIQMMGDVKRGHAFTRALLGVPAQTVYLCGDTSVVELVEQICDVTNDDLTIVPHQRLGPLTLMDPIQSLSDLRRGDCIICFSRRQARRVEQITGLRVSVIYGSLPPQARQGQAQLFNDPQSGYDILIATDAIGMGLNLNINRIIFSQLQKFDGNEVRQLTVSEMLQISGRAGRFGSEFPSGSVTYLSSDNITISQVTALKTALTSRPDRIDRAGLAPEFPQIQKIADEIPKIQYHSVLHSFCQYSTLDGIFFLSDSVIELAELSQHLQQLPLSLSDRHIFSCAPVCLRTRAEVLQLIQFATRFCHDHHVEVDIDIDTITRRRSIPLLQLESLSSRVDLYLWLSNRFQRQFPDHRQADPIRRQILNCIETALQQRRTDRSLTSGRRSG